MDKHTLEFIDNRLQATTALQSSLNVIIGADSVSMMAADASGVVQALQSWMFSSGEGAFEAEEWNIRRLLRDEDCFRYSFNQVHCALFHPHVTLVPKRLFQHSALATYFKLLLRPADFVFGYDELPEIEAYLVHATEAVQAKICAEFFPQARCRHLAVPLIRYLRSLPNDSDHKICVNFRHQVAQVVVFERQNLLFYNTFPFAAAADLLYFVLLAYDQFRLDTRETPLTVSGNLLPDSELYRLLYRFIREIRFAATPSDSYRLPAGVQALPDHCHLDLYCLKNI